MTHGSLLRDDTVSLVCMLVVAMVCGCAVAQGEPLREGQPSTLVLPAVPHVSRADMAPEVEWDYDYAKQTLVYAYAAYCNGTSLQQWDCKWCKELPQTTVTQYFYVDAIAGFVAYSGDTALLVYKGTTFTNIKEWIENFQINKLTPYKDDPKAKVHAGWYKAYQFGGVGNVTRTALQQLFSQHCPQCRKLLVTGHSLGASMATLAAIDLVERDLLPVPVDFLTFGSPRVGNREFVELWLQRLAGRLLRLQRVVNQHDAVAHLPSDWQHTGWCHLPTQVWHKTPTPREDYVICDGGPAPAGSEDPACSNNQLDLSVHDHLDYFGLPESCSS